MIEFEFTLNALGLEILKKLYHKARYTKNEIIVKHGLKEEFPDTDQVTFEGEIDYLFHKLLIKGSWTTFKISGLGIWALHEYGITTVVETPIPSRILEYLPLNLSWVEEKDLTPLEEKFDENLLWLAFP
ncbi:MAG: hypothetical protein ACXAC8_12510 [Candidatus Hodarchaeales archaeon]